MLKRRLKRSVKISIVVIIVMITFLIISLFSYNFMLSKVNSKENIVEFKIDSGTSINNIVNRLKEEHLIRSTFISKIYIKLHGINSMQAGMYELSSSYSTKEIIDMLHEGNVSNKDEINITFKEGKTMRTYAKVIDESTNNTEEDVFNLLKDENYIDSVIDKYWFITDEIKNKDIYYPLEGYLFPDTYRFANKDVTVEEIFTKMLDKMDSVLSNYKKEIQKTYFTIHEFLTFSSIVQSEGTNDSDWSKIADVFYNRLDAGIAFQSCVTACYAIKYDGVCTPNVVPVNLDNPYNTYTIAGRLPVGPISSPGLDAIEAALNPDTTDYYFFVADTNGKMYFTRNLTEHNAIIQELISKGLWW